MCFAITPHPSLCSWVTQKLIHLQLELREKHLFAISKINKTFMNFRHQPMLSLRKFFQERKVHKVCDVKE
jgi:hypothetical protein